MAQTLMQRIVEALPFLDRISDAVQPEVQKAVDAGGTTARNVLDGVWLEAPLHPVMTDVPIGAWTTALVFDGLDLATGKKPVQARGRRLAPVRDSGSVRGCRYRALRLAVPEWRVQADGGRARAPEHDRARPQHRLARPEGHGTQKRGTPDLPDRLLHQRHGRPSRRRALLPLRAARGQERLREAGPDDFSPVLDESDLGPDELRRVEVEGVGVLLSRSSGGEVCAIAATCNHFSGPLEQGEREDDTVVCPLHGSRFDLCSGQVIDGPAVFPQSRYETRSREGKIEVKAAAENIQKKVR